MGLDVRKPVFVVSNKVRFKPTCLATETTQKIEIVLVASPDTFQYMNNKGADQTARMHRLICAFIVRAPPKTGFPTSRPICDIGAYTVMS